MSNLNPTKSLINPYQLLGVTPNSTIPELKKSYYQLALLCHPDKGGNNDDMRVVHQSYKYIKRQMENANYTKSYEDLEQEFQQFCKEQEEIKPPTFMSIFEETNDFVREFNKRFQESVSNYDVVDPFKDGYGNLMDESVAPESFQINPNLNYTNNDTELVKPVANEFSRHIMVYKEPEYLPNTYGNFFHLDNKKIEDFSELQGDVPMTDYRLAFSPPEKMDYSKIEDYTQTFDYSAFQNDFPQTQKISELELDNSDVNKLYEDKLKQYQINDNQESNKMVN